MAIEISEEYKFRGLIIDQPNPGSAAAELWGSPSIPRAKFLLRGGYPYGTCAAKCEQQAMAKFLAVLVVMQFLCLTLATDLKVGLYNAIPDLGNDGLKSYKNMIQDGFAEESDGNNVEAITDPSQYSPYGPLEEYLTADNFDLIEIDTATLGQLVVKKLVLDLSYRLPALPDDTLPAAVDAVLMNGGVYAYPTLVCGNFLMGLTPPGSDDVCPLREARKNYEDFHERTETCKNSIVANPDSHYHRILGGKMNDADGWYLPFLYLDGYIDVHGKCSVEKAVYDVTQLEIVDGDVCEHLSWYVSQCNNQKEIAEPNKCYYEFPGSYVQSSSNVYEDIKDGKTAFLFGFSEKVAELANSEIVPYTAISGPLGPVNHLLQFTDALVVNKARWDEADEERRNAIRAFINYFLGYQVRYAISMGLDLDPPQNRYLLQAREELYSMGDLKYNSVYQDLLWSLKTAAPAPSLSPWQKEKMEKVLSEKCIKIEGETSTKLKEEL